MEQAEAKEVARRKGWIVRAETPTGVIELQSIVNGVPWYNTTCNIAAADTISTDECLPGGPSGLGLSGSGVKLGIWDEAAVLTTHQELIGRAVQSDLINPPSTTSRHATHVAGTMIAAGVDGSAEGMSPSATLDCYDWNFDVGSEIRPAAENGLRVSNHSYAYIVGWWYGDYVQGPAYYWFGDITVSPVEDYRFGFYMNETAWVDDIAYDNPYYLMCRSAGNDRIDNGPGAEGEHYVLTGFEWETSTVTRNTDGDYDSIVPRAAAKNILTVGAVADLPGGWSGPGSVNMTTFSGWGPADDGRIKPDITGNGIDLYSSSNEATNSDYYIYSGTSQSTPNVSGSLGLLIEHWRTSHSGESDMLSSTLKGLVLHTADEAGPADGPDYMYGWGLMNTLAAANTISADVAEPLTISEWRLYDGDWLELLITTDGTSDLRATICWTDPAGTPTSNQVDPATKMLVNDLDLRIERTSPLTTYQPWVLDGTNPSAAATKDDNDTDNVEQVIVSSPSTDDFVLFVTHKAALSGGSQVFSVIITGAAQIQVSSAMVSGSVTSSATSATVLPDVRMSGANSGQSDFSDAAGSYELSLPVGGSETVTPCKDGWLFQPSSRSYAPVTGALTGEDFGGSLVYDLYPTGGDEAVGVGDLSLFTQSWLQTVPPGDADHDFDCNMSVSVGDFSYFATAWLKDSFDPTILFPPCQICGGARATEHVMESVYLDLRLVAVPAIRPEDVTQTLPESAGWFGTGRSYFVEIWVRDSDGAGPGVTSAYVNVLFDSGRSMARTVLPSDAFGTLVSGSIDESAVRDVGGSTLFAGMGTEGWWARVAIIEMEAIASGRVEYDLGESAIGFAAYGQGTVPWNHVEKFGVSLDHIEPVRPGRDRRAKRIR